MAKEKIRVEDPGRSDSTCARLEKGSFAYAHVERYKPPSTSSGIQRIRGHDEKAGVRLTPIDRLGEDRERAREETEKLESRGTTEVREQERGAATVLCSGVVFGVRGAGPTDGKS